MFTSVCLCDTNVDQIWKKLQKEKTLQLQRRTGGEEDVREAVSSVQRALKRYVPGGRCCAEYLVHAEKQTICKTTRVKTHTDDF